MKTVSAPAQIVGTIGYEGATLDDFVATLTANRIGILVDIRDRAQSRRKGFSKSALSSAVQAHGIGYVHLRALGDPKPGREAARAGNWNLFLSIYNVVLESPAAIAALKEAAHLSEANSICLMCFEKDYKDCHRNIVADIVAKALDKKPVHLKVKPRVGFQEQQGRVLHSRQGAAASI